MEHLFLKKKPSVSGCVCHCWDVSVLRNCTYMADMVLRLALAVTRLSHSPAAAASVK